MRKPLYLALGLVFFLSTSCLEQGKVPKVPGVDGPHINIQDGKITLAVTFERIGIPAGVSGTIPKMTYSTGALAPTLDGGTLVKVAFDPRDVESDTFRNVPPEKLPNGKDFPITADGTLPALALNMPRILDMTVYASNDIFGVFIPFNLPKDFPVQVDIPFSLVINKKRIGVISYIAPDHSGEGSGVLLVLNLKKIRGDSEFESLLEFSKKHPKAIF